MKKNKKKRKNYKRGSELAQTVLITAVMIMLIATIFFPQIQGIFTTAMSKMSTWFNNALNIL
ncbi:MAG: hypothetical protein IKV94_03685 [Clostridia bacterium]|nr:hypothetical protein [Clostridia bacterium]